MRCVVFEEDLHVSVSDMRLWLPSYLTDASMEGVHDFILHTMPVRPLYISVFWINLIMNENSECSITDIFSKCLNSTFSPATLHSEQIVKSLWICETITYHSNLYITSLFRFLFYAIMMDSSNNWIVNLRDKMRIAIQQGVLSICSDTTRINIENEPITKQSIVTIGMRRVRERSKTIAGS